MDRPERPVFLSRGVALAVAVVLVPLLAAAGWFAYRHLFFQHTPRFRASEAVLQAARRNKALSPAEFAEALRLADCGEWIVELRAWAAIGAAVEADPRYKPEAVALFARLAADPSDPQRQASAARQLKRLTDPPPAAGP